MSQDEKKILSQDFSHAVASHVSENELIDGLKNRSDESFVLLIDTYLERLNRLAFHLLKKQEDAEDAVQETLMKIVEKIHTFEKRSSLYSWICRICLNQCFMSLRNQKGKKYISWEEHGPKYEHGIRIQSISSWEKLPDEIFLEKEFQSFVSECVENLTEDLKTAYVLKDIEDLDEDTVCEILEINKSTMRNRVHRARLILRELLEQKYVR